MRSTGGFTLTGGSPLKRPTSTMKKTLPASRTLLSGKKDVFHAVGAMTLQNPLSSMHGTSHGHLHDHNHHGGDHLIELESPTSISMKNSYIIKNADPSFETYYNAMKKRNKLLGHADHHTVQTSS